MVPEMLEHGRPAIVSEADVVEHDLPTYWAQHPRDRSLPHLGIGVEHLEDAVHRGEAAGDDQVELRESLHRLVEQPEVGVERHERSDRESTAEHFEGTKPEHQDRPDRREKPCSSERHRLELHVGEDAVKEAFTLLVKRPGLGFFLCERLDRGDRSELLVKLAGYLLQLVMDGPALLSEPPGEPEAYPRLAREPGEREQCDLAVPGEQRDNAARE